MHLSHFYCLKCALRVFRLVKIAFFQDLSIAQLQSDLVVHPLQTVRVRTGRILLDTYSTYAPLHIRLNKCFRVLIINLGLCGFAGLEVATKLQAVRRVDVCSPSDLRGLQTQYSSLSETHVQQHRLL